MSLYEESGKRHMIKVGIEPAWMLLTGVLPSYHFLIYIFFQSLAGQALAVQTESLSLFDEKQNIL